MSHKSESDFLLPDRVALFNTPFPEYKRYANKARQFAIVMSISQLSVSARIFHESYFPIHFIISKALHGKIAVNDVLELSLTYIGSNNDDDDILTGWRCEDIVKLDTDATMETLQRWSQLTFQHFQAHNPAEQYRSLFRWCEPSHLYGFPFPPPFESCPNLVFQKFDGSLDSYLDLNQLSSNPLASVLDHYIPAVLNINGGLKLPGNPLNGVIFLGVEFAKEQAVAHGASFPLSKLNDVRSFIDGWLKATGVAELCSVQYLPVFEAFPSKVPTYDLDHSFAQDSTIIQKWKSSDVFLPQGRVLSEPRRWIICIQVSRGIKPNYFSSGKTTQVLAANAPPAVAPPTAFLFTREGVRILAAHEVDERTNSFYQSLSSAPSQPVVPSSQALHPSPVQPVQSQLVQQQQVGLGFGVGLVQQPQLQSHQSHQFHQPLQPQYHQMSQNEYKEALKWKLITEMGCSESQLSDVLSSFALTGNFQEDVRKLTSILLA